MRIQARPGAQHASLPTSAYLPPGGYSLRLCAMCLPFNQMQTSAAMSTQQQCPEGRARGATVGMINQRRGASQSPA